MILRTGGLPSLPGLPTFSYGVDGEGRINTVSAGSGQNPVSNVTYNLYGSPPQLQLTFGSGDSDTYSYDANTGRMTQYKFTVGTSPQSVVGNLTWNQNGSLQQHQITDPFNAANTQICAYQHDDVSRIANVDCGTGGWGQSFAYDAFSNITKNVLQNRTGNSFQPTYQTSPSITNRIATLPGNITVNYDANGNTLTDGTYTYSWDVESRPTTIATSSTVSLTFDALGRAVEQLKNATYTQMVYGPAGGKLALMSGQTLQRAFVALPAGTSAVYSASGLDHYQHTDWLGSARLTSTLSRTVSGDTAYAPFGETYAQSGTPDFSFTGQNQDTAGGLYDFLYREFSTQGRWHSPDPAGLTAVSFDDPQSLNRYAYARNMPDMLTDPLGLCPECRGGRDPLCMLERVEIACSLAFSLFQSGASMPCPSNNCTGVKFTAGSGGVDVLQQWVPYVSGSYIGTNGFTLATTTGYWSTIRGGGVMDAFWTIWGAYWDNVPYAGSIFIPIPQTGYTVSFMIPFASIPSTNTNCVGLGLAATTPTGKFVAGGPLLFGNLKNAKAILSGWGFNFGGQSTPFVGVQAVSNKSGSLGGPTLATSTGLSGGYGYSVCR